MASVPTSADLPALYRDTRERVAEMVGSLGPGELAAPVPACPGWSVADVVSHLAAVGEDVLAGRLTGPPDAEQTAEQVARHRGRPIAEVVGTWTEVAPQFEDIIANFEVWPAVLDVASHEHDIRGALGRPGARDTEVVRAGAERLVTLMRPPVPMVVRVEDAEFPVGPSDDGAGGGSRSEPLVIDTTRFEVVRWRLGRRSRAQLAALTWSADPAPVLDHLVIFGPSPEDIHE
ncbi:MAG TPA: maleylpyruvate isomerase family mycothiol-dependent enzyme [Acidimicrobiales bacterium]|nr:maleylpyruvate isomerase family mycothiol-dependent enzyme [Acidimicrobiales bacterium]